MNDTSVAFSLPAGRIAAEVTGPEGAPLVIGIPGLSATLRCFDAIFPGLPAHRRLALDLRGRGRSDKTPPGTYGWLAHARDILAIADQLGADRFDLVGWSMGVWVAMTVAQLAPERVRRMVFIDALGAPEEAVKAPIGDTLRRLGTVYPSRDAFYEMSRNLGFYDPWSDWEPYFEYGLEDVEGGVRQRTTLLGPGEDLVYLQSQDLHALCRSVRGPALVIRAARPIPPNSGHVLTLDDYERFLEDVPTARGIEVDAHHFTVIMHRDAVQAVTAFLCET